MTHFPYGDTDDLVTQEARVICSNGTGLNIREYSEFSTRRVDMRIFFFIVENKLTVYTT